VKQQRTWQQLQRLWLVVWEGVLVLLAAPRHWPHLQQQQMFLLAITGLLGMLLRLLQ
jgi:hypothetical protein